MDRIPEGAQRRIHLLDRRVRLAAPGQVAGAIFDLLESVGGCADSHVGSVPGVTKLSLLMFNASIGDNWQIASASVVAPRAVDRRDARGRALP